MRHCDDDVRIAGRRVEGLIAAAPVDQAHTVLHGLDRLVEAEHDLGRGPVEHGALGGVGRRERGMRERGASGRDGEEEDRQGE
ncbi:hypothetical protein GCM10029992_35710 [Glycomyces albus]